MEQQVLHYERMSSLDVPAGRLVLATAGGVSLRAPATGRSRQVVEARRPTGILAMAVG